MAMIAAACGKEKVVTTPCDFKVSLDEVKGSKVTFTIDPGNKDACYTFAVAPKGSFAGSTHVLSDEELMEKMVADMESSFMGFEKEGGAIGSFAGAFCYRGERTITKTGLDPDRDYLIVVFQVNPETRKSIGILYKTEFHTKEVEMVSVSFIIECLVDTITIIPSDDETTWFWEYELSEKIEEKYGSTYDFFYSIVDMYEKYGFLKNLLNRGHAEWTFSKDDPSFREGETYSLAIAGCKDGEFTSYVSSIDFSFHDGGLYFEQTGGPDIDIHYLGI